MARRPRRKPVSKNRGTMHGKWLQNAVKGFGAAYANVLKDIAPNTTELVTSTANVARDMAVSINRNRAGVNRISTSLSNNKFVKLANKAYNNALNDLKAGNIHGDDSRMMDAAGFGDFMNDSGFSFGDDGAGSVNVNYIAGGGDNSALLNTVSSEIKDTLQYLLQTWLRLETLVRR